jgi:hypothetical protein
MQVDYVRVWATSPQDVATTTGSSTTAPLDTTAPDAEVFAPSSQKLRASVVVVTVSCPHEPCKATARGTIRVPRLRRARAATFKLAARTTTIAKDMRVQVRLKLRRDARAAITRALRAGRRIVLKLNVSVADEAGNIRPRTRQVMLRC